MVEQTELGKRTIFDVRNTKNTEDRKWAAKVIDAGAVSVLGEELALTARDSISPRGLHRGSINDPLVSKLGTALITVGQVLRLDEGDMLSYISALIYARSYSRGVPAGDMREKLEEFASTYFRPEEVAIAHQVSYLIEMGTDNRASLLNPMRRVISDEPMKPRRSVANAFDAWERLAEYVATKETPVSGPATGGGRMRGNGGRA